MQGLGRFSASRVYKEETSPEEESKASGFDLWIAEGEVLTDVNRFSVIASGEGTDSDLDA